jgi:hypothetical protein
MNTITNIQHAKRHLFEYSNKLPTKISMSQMTKEMLCLVAPPEWVGYRTESRSEMAKKPLKIVGLDVVIDKTVALGHGRVGHDEMAMDVPLITEKETDGSKPDRLRSVDPDGQEARPKKG